jgi:hypothetical protein
MGCQWEGWFTRTGCVELLQPLLTNEYTVQEKVVGWRLRSTSIPCVIIYSYKGASALRQFQLPRDPFLTEAALFQRARCADDILVTSPKAVIRISSPIDFPKCTVKSLKTRGVADHVPPLASSPAYLTFYFFFISFGHKWK